MIKVIGLFSLMNEDFELGEGRLFFFPQFGGMYGYNSVYAGGFLPLLFISDKP